MECQRDFWNTSKKFYESYKSINDSHLDSLNELLDKSYSENLFVFRSLKESTITESDNGSGGEMLVRSQEMNKIFDEIEIPRNSEMMIVIDDESNEMEMELLKKAKKNSLHVQR